MGANQPQHKHHAEISQMISKSLLTIACFVMTAGTACALTLKATEFELQSGEKVAAELGSMEVPENRTEVDSRKITIRFLRFKSRASTPGTPIVYLAGGPGGSGTGAARGRRWAMFDRLRDVADVIILDQRGTGMSSALPICQPKIEIPADVPTTRELYVRLHRVAMDKCLAFWQQEGVDIRGYTSPRSPAGQPAGHQLRYAPRLGDTQALSRTHRSAGAGQR